jgi:hypothetical protein
MFDGFGDRARIAIESDDFMSAAHQPAGHVAAHSPEPDHRELHARLLLRAF